MDRTEDSLPRRRRSSGWLRRQILVAGAVEVIDRGTGKAEAERKEREMSRHPFGSVAPGPDRRQLGQIDQAFVRANVKPGTTLILSSHAAYPGLSGDYRHDPRVVGK